eukprot:Rmarinus@m.24149
MSASTSATGSGASMSTVRADADTAKLTCCGKNRSTVKPRPTLPHRIWVRWFACATRRSRIMTKMRWTSSWSTTSALGAITSKSRSKTWNTTWRRCAARIFPTVVPYRISGKR